MPSNPNPGPALALILTLTLTPAQTLTLTTGPKHNQFELAFCFGDADSEPGTSYRGKEAACGRLLAVELPRSRGSVRARHPATRRLDGRTSLLFVLEHPGGNERVEDLIEWCGPAKRLATYLCPCNSPAHHLLLAD